MERGYELIRRIAGGGMGEVFVARRTGAANFEKLVALKLLLPHLANSDELLERFHDEARLAARMHHPNIVEIFDVGETAERRPFIAMQLVDGVTLGRLIRDLHRRQEAMPLPLIRLVATGLCEALSYAHQLTDTHGRPLGVVHRDVSPGNTLVSRNGAVMLTDFGIAKVRDTSRTDPGVVRGKFAYVAPEQILFDAPVDARTDVYSAAITLYELLTGVQPHRRQSNTEALEAVVAAHIPRVDTLRPDIPLAMANALHQALKPVHQERTPTARALRESFVDGPVATAPELAEYVQRVCAEALQLRLDVDDVSGPVTGSVLRISTVVKGAPADHPMATQTLSLAPTPTRRLWWVLGALVLLVVSGLGWVLMPIPATTLELAPPVLPVSVATAPPPPALPAEGTFPPTTPQPVIPPPVVSRPERRAPDRRAATTTAKGLLNQVSRLQGLAERARRSGHDVVLLERQLALVRSRLEADQGAETMETLRVVIERLADELAALSEDGAPLRK